jgi:hypothetical protein
MDIGLHCPLLRIAPEIKQRKRRPSGPRKPRGPSAVWKKEDIMLRISLCGGPCTDRCDVRNAAYDVSTTSIRLMVPLPFYRRQKPSLTRGMQQPNTPGMDQTERNLLQPVNDRERLAVARSVDPRLTTGEACRWRPRRGCPTRACWGCNPAGRWPPRSCTARRGLLLWLRPPSARRRSWR